MPKPVWLLPYAVVSRLFVFLLRCVRWLPPPTVHGYSRASLMPRPPLCPPHAPDRTPSLS